MCSLLALGNRPLAASSRLCFGSPPLAMRLHLLPPTRVLPHKPAHRSQSWVVLKPEATQARSRSHPSARHGGPLPSSVRAAGLPGRGLGVVRRAGGAEGVSCTGELRLPAPGQPELRGGLLARVEAGWARALVQCAHACGRLCQLQTRSPHPARRPLPHDLVAPVPSQAHNRVNTGERDT